MADLNDDELLDALGVDVAPLKTSSRTPLEERIIAGFEDTQRFFEENKRLPFNGEIDVLLTCTKVTHSFLCRRKPHKH